MNGSDKDIQAWDSRLKRQTLRGWDNYVRRRIDLSIARTVEYWGIPGEFLYVEEVSSESANASIRINRNTNDALDLKLDATIKTIFKNFYITNAAQAGEWIDIIIGINFEYYRRPDGKIGAELQPAIIITSALPNTNTVGAANICNGALIQAPSGNGGTVWLNAGAAAVANSCYEILPGDAVKGNISNTNRLNALFAIGGDRLIVLFEV